MFDIQLLPADHGDCIWIEYGKPGKTHRILIDGGTKAKSCYDAFAARAKTLPDGKRNFELFVITHIDDDHIGGVMNLLQGKHGCTFDDVWFNSYAQLVKIPPDKMGAVQGEAVSKYLLKTKLAWNREFKGLAVMAPTMTRTLPGGMKLTVVAPTSAELKKLAPKWASELKRKGMKPSMQLPDVLGAPNIDALAKKKFDPDKSLPNGSSIVILAEYDGKRCLFAGDGHGPVIAAGIKRLLGGKPGRLSVDAFKVPHHGSKYNVSPDLVKLVDTSKYLVSTNGNIFKHPDKEAIARIIKFGGNTPELYFNYRTKFNAVWDDKNLMKKRNYSVVYPAEASYGISVSL